MKSPVGKFRPELENLTRTARETMATEMLTGAPFKAALMASAGAGLTAHRFTMPVDLRSTAAAARAVAWCHRQGLQHTWLDRSPAEAHGETVYDLVVSWGGAAPGLFAVPVAGPPHYGTSPAERVRGAGVTGLPVLAVVPAAPIAKQGSRG